MLGENSLSRCRLDFYIARSHVDSFCTVLWEKIINFHACVVLLEEFVDPMTYKGRALVYQTTTDPSSSGLIVSLVLPVFRVGNF